MSENVESDQEPSGTILDLPITEEVLESASDGNDPEEHSYAVGHEKVDTRASEEPGSHDVVSTEVFIDTEDPEGNLYYFAHSCS